MKRLLTFVAARTDDGSSPRRPPGAAGSGLLGLLLRVGIGALVLVTLFMLSLIFFVMLIAGGLLLWGYVWWQRRKLRRQAHTQTPGGRVFEGEGRVIDAGDKDNAPP